MKNDEFLFKVQLIEEWDGFPEGTCMYVEKELEYEYEGTIILMFCTVPNVRFPKKICDKQ